MIKKDKLKEIQNSESYPSISILMPTHRTYPDNQQDPIRLNNLVSSVKARLGKEFNKKELGSIYSNLDELIETINFNHVRDGLALYVNSDKAYKFSFPFKIEERVIIDKNFAVRDVVFLINRSEPYWLLLINEKETCLYYCIREDFTEVTNSGFPVINRLRENIQDDMDLNEKVKLDPEKMKIYLREADSALKKLNTDGNEIIVAAIERYSSFFKTISSQKELIAGSINGSYNKADKSLVSESWDLIRDIRRANRTNILEKRDNYIKNNLFVTGIDEVWQAAVAGRIERLLTDVHYSYAAKISDDGTVLEHSVSSDEADVTDDAVDEIIEITLNKGGKVTFYNDELNEYGKIAAYLRY